MVAARITVAQRASTKTRFNPDVQLQGKKPNEMEEVQKLEGMLEGKVRIPQ